VIQGGIVEVVGHSANKHKFFQPWQLPWLLQVEHGGAEVELGGVVVTEPQHLQLRAPEKKRCVVKELVAAAMGDVDSV